MMKNKCISLLGCMFVAIAMISAVSCSHQYDNHALAVMNNTDDTIVLVRHISSLPARNISIAPGEYGKFFETSTDMWLGPVNELKKCSDSLWVELPDKTLMFSENYTRNTSANPYSMNSEWQVIIEDYETSAFIGTRVESFYIHYFEINGN